MDDRKYNTPETDSMDSIVHSLSVDGPKSDGADKGG
jgi:hypothetical protein